MFNLGKMSLWRYSVYWSLVPLKFTYDDISDSPLSAETSASDLTGLDRLRLMFSLKSDVSPELNSCIHCGMTGLFFGALYGGFIRSRKAYLDFFENNQATAFKSHLEAKKVLQDHVTINFAKGAVAWALRLGIFTGSLALISTSMSVYRGKARILDFAVAGGISGTLFRSNLGFRGMLVGGLLGTVLGTCGGSLIIILLKSFNLSMEDVRGFHYEVHSYRVKARLERDRRLLEQNTPTEQFLKDRETSSRT